MAYAVDLSDINVLLSGYISDQSRLMLHRRIAERVRTIAPFLAYDSDPYIVVWRRRPPLLDPGCVHDLHHVPLFGTDGPGGINYIRNSVKVVIDAYNGDVSYYVIDPTDPLVRTYRKIFPTLFKPIRRCPRSCSNTCATPWIFSLLRPECMPPTT